MFSYCGGIPVWPSVGRGGLRWGGRAPGGGIWGGTGAPGGNGGIPCMPPGGGGGMESPDERGPSPVMSDGGRLTPTDTA